MAHADYQPVDRRANPRKVLQVPILMTPPGYFSLTSGRTQDISLLGVKVKTEITPSPFHTGDEINFIINEDFLLLQGQGRIRWTSTKGDMVGIEYTQLDEETKRSLDGFLRFLKPVATDDD